MLMTRQGSFAFVIISFYAIGKRLSLGRDEIRDVGSRSVGSTFFVPCCGSQNFLKEPSICRGIALKRTRPTTLGLSHLYSD